MSVRPFFRVAVRTGMILWLWSMSGTLLLGPLAAQAGTDFPGTVLSVDAAAGKLAVNKEAGGTRFTFVVNGKTQFGGAGATSLKDLKKGDSVTVTYVVTGSQYVAEKVIKR